MGTIAILLTAPYQKQRPRKPLPVEDRQGPLRRFGGRTRILRRSDPGHPEIYLSRRVARRCGASCRRPQRGYESAAGFVTALRAFRESLGQYAVHGGGDIGARLGQAGRLVELVRP